MERTASILARLASTDLDVLRAHRGGASFVPRGDVARIRTLASRGLFEVVDPRPSAARFVTRAWMFRLSTLGANVLALLDAQNPECITTAPAAMVARAG